MGFPLDGLKRKCEEAPSTRSGPGGLFQNGGRHDLGTSEEVGVQSPPDGHGVTYTSLEAPLVLTTPTDRPQS